MSTNSAETQVFTFRANDDQFDRYQDRNKVSGWLLDNYNANPVVLLNHNAQELAIGKGRAYVQGNALMCDVQFDQADEFAKRVEGKIRGGYLNAVSVRYLLQDGKFRVNERGGIDSDEQELLEVSIVTIPGNQRAVRVKSEGGSNVRTLELRAMGKLDSAARGGLDMKATSTELARAIQRQMDINELATLFQMQELLKKD
jgi:HK97 family phage prohead protease